MATIEQVERAIFEREGFRVKLEPLPGARKALPAYDHELAAYNRWKLDEWQMVRMAPYIPFLKHLSVLRPDGTRATSNLQLGNLRNAYFEHLCGEELARLSPPEPSKDGVRGKGGRAKKR